MEVPNRLSSALMMNEDGDGDDSDTMLEKLDEWSQQVEFLCNPPTTHQKKAASQQQQQQENAAEVSSPATTTASTASSSGGDSTTNNSDGNPNNSPPSASTALVVEKEESSKVSVATAATEEDWVVDDDSMVSNLSERLHLQLLKSMATSSLDGEIDLLDDALMEDFFATQIAVWKESTKTASCCSSPSPLLASVLRACKNWIRWYLQIYSSKVRRRKTLVVAALNQSTTSSNSNSSSNISDDPIHCFKSRTMLDFYMDLLNQLILPPAHQGLQQQQQEQEQNRRQEEKSILARHVALLLFYATFDPIPPENPSSMQQQQKKQKNEEFFFTKVLQLLVHVSYVPLALALMRNVHNAAVYHSKSASLAMAQACVTKEEEEEATAAAAAAAAAAAVATTTTTTAVEDDDDGDAYDDTTTTTTTPRNAVCPWAPLVSPRLDGANVESNGSQNSNGKDEMKKESSSSSSYTYLTLFCNMIAFCLWNQDPTPFPGSSYVDMNDHTPGAMVGDERAELVCEILRTLYASRIGHEQLTASRSDLNQLDQQDEQHQQPHLHRLIIDLLTLGQDDNSDNDMDQKRRITECQLDTVSLLMDCGPGLMSYIVDKSSQAVDSLLSLLDRQVECVLDQCSTLSTRKTTSTGDGSSGGDASAMLTPILVVVHRFCQGSPAFRKQTFLSIFPASAEADYQRLVEEQQQLVKKSKKKKNMSPLDAPVGTKRWRMIQLLTCVPQSSHVKRFAGELLWVLCGQNPQEFTQRVGFGNALPILAVKGYAQLPAHVT